MGNKIRGIAGFSMIFLLATIVIAAQFTDNSQSDFDEGTYTNTTYNGSAVILSSGKTTGTFVSRVFDASVPANYNNLDTTYSNQDIYELYAVDGQADVWKSTDGGITWSMIKDDYNDGAGNDANAMTSDGSNLYIIHNQDTWRSDDSGITWTLVNDDFNPGVGSAAQFITYNGSDLFIVDGTEDIYHSSDQGTTWAQSYDDFNGGNGNAFGFVTDSNNVLWIVDTQADVWNSTNGYSWTLVKDDYNAGEGNNPNSLIIDENDYLYIVESDDDIWRSVDKGITWTKINDDYNGEGQHVQSTIFQDGRLYIAEADEDLWVSEDQGLNWTKAATNFNGGNGNIKGMAKLNKQTNISFKVRNCSISDCSDGTFQSADSFELNSRYFQYSAEFSSTAVGKTSALESATIDYTLLNQQPTVQVSILPPSPITTDDIECYFTVNDPDTGDSLTANITWYKNSIQQFKTTKSVTNSVQNTVTLLSTNTSKSNVWNCSVIAYDGTVTSNTNTTSVTIQNSQPIVSSLSMTPSNSYTHNDLTCSFTITDLDSESLNADIKWYKNNVLYSSVSQAVTNGTSVDSILDSSNTAKNEVWNCSISPRDGSGYGKTKTTQETIQNSLPIAPSIEINPTIPITTDDLNIIFNQVSTDNDSDSITYSYAWYRNSTLQPGQTTSSISSGLTAKNQNWTVIVTPNDGQDNGIPDFYTVIIQNSIPSITSATISPDPAFKSSTLSASASGWSDVDGESANYQYQWFNQDGSIAGQTASTLSNDYFNKSDTIYCNITPFDTDDLGTTLKSNEITILNTPPTVSSISLRSSLGFNGTDEDIIANFSYYDLDSDTKSDEQMTWYKDSQNIPNLDNLTTVPYSLIDAGELWILSVRVKDDEEWGEWYNSSDYEVLEISQTYPVLLGPSNNSYINKSETILQYRAPNYNNQNCSIFGGTSIYPGTRVKQNQLSGAQTIIFNWKNLVDDTYYWKVGCINESYMFNSSTKMLTIDTLPPTTAPNITEVTDSDKDGNIDISWTVDPDAGSYNIYRSSNMITDISQATLVGSANTNTFEDNTTTVGNTYHYAVITLDRAGNKNTSVFSSSLSGRPNDTIPSVLPTIINISSDTGITQISWNKVEKDTHDNPDALGLSFRVWYRKTSTIPNSTQNASQIAQLVGTKDQSDCSDQCTFTHSLSGTQQYTYFITTIDDAGNENQSIGSSIDVFASLAPASTVSIPTPASSSGGGGGGGGGIYSKPDCEPQWSCSEWYSCVNGTQARTCIDANECRNNKDKPEEKRECAGCEERWQCGSWTDCTNGLQTRSCIDLNGCGTKSALPKEKKECATESCNDGEKNNGEVGVDCGGPCRPCRASDFITGGAIAIQNEKGTNPYLLIPTIFLLVAFIVAKSLHSKYESLAKIMNKLRIPISVAILSLFIFSFFGNAIIGLIIADPSDNKDITGAGQDIAAAKDTSSALGTKAQVTSSIFMILAAMTLTALVFKRKYPGKFNQIVSKISPKATKKDWKLKEELRKHEENKKVPSDNKPEKDAPYIEIIPENIKEESVVSTTEDKTDKGESNLSREDILEEIKQLYK